MKKYFTQYQPFLLFLGKFFLAYFVFTLIYRIYIGTFGNDCIDGITENVSVLTGKFSNLIGIKLSVVSDYKHYNILYNNKITATIIEGCNAVSVIVLFISFVIAFSGKLNKRWFLY